MTSAEIRAAIDQAIETEDFEAPVSIAYCEALRKRIVKALGKTASVEVYHHHHTLLVNATVGKATASVKVPLV